MAIGRKTGGRTIGTPNKATLERKAAMDAAIQGALEGFTQDELDKLGPRDGLLAVMRWALKTGALPLFVAIATSLMPYYHAKKAPVVDLDPDASSADEIAADCDPEFINDNPLLAAEMQATPPPSSGMPRH